MAACGSSEKVDPNSTKAVETLYAEGKDELTSGGYDRAIKIFERVEGRAAGTLLAQQASRDAYQSFRQVVDQFPQSRYAGDAKLRMDYIVNALAEYELHVSRYYFRRGAYVAAVNRAQQVLLEFPQAPATEEALSLMVTSYQQLGLDGLAKDAQRVLEKNFPQSRFLSGDSAQSKKSWWQFW